MLFVDGSPVNPAAAVDGSAAQGGVLPAISPFGDGVFETILLHKGRLHLVERHMQRMQRGATQLGLAFDPTGTAAELKAVTEYLVAGWPQDSFRIRLLLQRAFSESGYSVRDGQTRRIISANRVSFPLTTPVELNVSPVRLAPQPWLAGIKHCNRLENILARRQLERSSFDDSLMLDQSGHVVECIAANIFVRKGEHLLTPSLDTCGVSGVMRAHVIEHVAPESGLAVAEATLGIDELLAADSLFITSAVAGIRAVARLDNGEQQRGWEACTRIAAMQQVLARSLSGCEPGQPGQDS